MRECKSCGADFDVFGNEGKRPSGDGNYYYCRQCGSRKKPVEKPVAMPKAEDILPEQLKIHPWDLGVLTENIDVTDPVFFIKESDYDYTKLNIRVLPDKPRTLYIPDLHAPFMKDGSIDFLNDIYKKYHCNNVVLLGDILDNHYSSYHETDPDGLSANKELKLAAKQITEVAKAFPTAKVCIGNHDAVPQRKVFSSGLSNRWVKTVKDVLLELGVPCEQWEFADSWYDDGVKSNHGTGRKAKQRMLQDGVSTVQGHYHAESYIHFHVNEVQKIFAMQLGALIDDDAYAFAYSKHFAKSHKNCGVVAEGVPVIEHMDLGSRVING